MTSCLWLLTTPGARWSEPLPTISWVGSEVWLVTAVSHILRLWLRGCACAPYALSFSGWPAQACFQPSSNQLILLIIAGRQEIEVKMCKRFFQACVCIKMLISQSNHIAEPELEWEGTTGQNLQMKGAAYKEAIERGYKKLVNRNFI